MSADPAGPVDGLNLYVYVSDNPVRKTDPQGTAEAEFDDYTESLINDEVGTTKSETNEAEEQRQSVDTAVRDRQENRRKAFEGKTVSSNFPSDDSSEVINSIKERGAKTLDGPRETRIENADIVILQGHHYADHIGHNQRLDLNPDYDGNIHTTDSDVPGYFELDDMGKQKFDLKNVQPNENAELVVITGCSGISEPSLKYMAKKFPNAHIIGRRDQSPGGGLIKKFIDELPDDFSLDKEGMTGLIKEFEAFAEKAADEYVSGGKSSGAVFPGGLGWSSPQGKSVQRLHIAPGKNKANKQWLDRRGRSRNRLNTSPTLPPPITY